MNASTNCESMFPILGGAIELIDNLEMRPEINVKVRVTQNGMHNSAIPKGIHTPNWDSYIKEYRRYAPDMIILVTRS